MPCPMFGWYEEKGGEEELPINSVIEGTLIVPPKGNARIVTRTLEKQGKSFECAVESNVTDMFHRAGVKQDYGLIIILPGEYRKLSGSMVVDFISFHRHPSEHTDKPTYSRFGVADYTDVFDKLAVEELANKETQLSQIIGGSLPRISETGA